jgi:hypothetical protein
VFILECREVPKILQTERWRSLEFFLKCRSLAIVVESLLLFQASCHQSPSTNSSPSTSLFSTKKIVRFAFFFRCLRTGLSVVFKLEAFSIFCSSLKNSQRCFQKECRLEIFVERDERR